MHVGPMPAQLAILNNISARCEEWPSRALEGDLDKVYYACLFDPLTSAVLGMQEIHNMVDGWSPSARITCPCSSSDTRDSSARGVVPMGGFDMRQVAQNPLE